jgi:hypothetical protein
MPFKSRAQRRKFSELLVKGEISPETFEEWNRETGSTKLPERVIPRVKQRRKKTRPKAQTQGRRKSTASSKKKSTRRSK